VARGRERFPPVVVFDLDGTLLRGTSVAMFLAGRLGHAGTLDALERAFVAGEISSHAIADASAAQYTGRAIEEIASLLAEAPWIDGLAATLAELRDAGSHVLLATITWRFAAETLQRRHGFDAVSGTEIEISGGVVGGGVTRYFDEHDKRDFVVGWCAGRGIPLTEVVAVGDSRSDIPVFAAVGRSIAFNATAEARAAASVALDTDDLRDVLPLLRARP